VYDRHALLLIVVMLIGRLTWVYYQQKYHSDICRSVLTYWLRDWCHNWLTDCWSRMSFCCNNFFVTAVVYSRYWIFIWLLWTSFDNELNDEYFIRQIFKKNSFWVATSYVEVCLNYLLRMAFFEHRYFTG